MAPGGIVRKGHWPAELGVVRHRRTSETGGSRLVCYHPRASAACIWFAAESLVPERKGEVPNIKQQEKRVRSAARQRLENLRYRSTVKTLTKRLETAVADGDVKVVATEHLALVRMIDKAASKGALHSNTAGRKKSQAAGLVAGKSA